MSSLPHQIDSTVSQAAIERRLFELGYRMECCLASVDGEGHSVIDVATGECVDPPSAEVLELATAWSEIEGL